MSEFIYSTKKYHEISLIGELEKFQIDNLENIYSFKNLNQALFGVYAPFWHPKFLKGNSDYLKLENILRELMLQIAKKNFKEALIRLPPNFYDPSIALFEFLLFKHGFFIENVALWQAICLKGYNSHDQYECSLKHSARKVLKKFSIDEVVFEKINNEDKKEVEVAYSIINANRMQRGIKLKYDLNYLLSLIESFPQIVNIFTLKINGQNVASAICHQTNDNILYVAAWGDSGHSLSASPMYTFSSKLVEFCLMHNYEYLDFGVSTDLNSDNEKLYSFKRNIGCKPYLQKTLKKLITAL